MVILLSNCKCQRMLSIQEVAKAAAVLNTCQRTLVTQCGERQSMLPKTKQNKLKRSLSTQLMPPKTNGFKRPITALEDYQYDNRTFVGKRVKLSLVFLSLMR
ncbi:hypothetical protein PHYBLDRAFT_165966 [Phycomyces blakesleeanus NRRL 1555(-)]|uniref:Homeodomain-like DNA binding domain-containing transcription factor n=1 Tax=Phycomyces blakesleeanus (strain ATCC 8743b / DSM 1359 / FGSC 10004 / NBRC 33097 / NRRL 1555) TaxID=763407 RepID=A0A162UKK7_PHYB8|nr:hypothetical protein PHYBLDRAFT_165966 [Phycomyces blakesleeanus NRRL 1555(-)]OAD75993.1 hypothetical protein PHYBLDRAFT_165966 [Phycomyces blakesleeanus NRRL 1555(-)]|eukprot:XP_018294033.1 hypothetical protein PHYBLDRAFT_165966 [Phycomyces blakesleeanus NRRL 1555(-)]